MYTYSSCEWNRPCIRCSGDRLNPNKPVIRRPRDINSTGHEAWQKNRNCNVTRRNRKDSEADEPAGSRPGDKAIRRTHEDKSGACRAQNVTISQMSTMKTMLITGASRGIGAATALLAARNGYAVAVNYHKNRPAADDVVDRIIAQGGRAVAIQADVSRQDEIVRLFSELDRHFGKLDCLINNAGILENQKKFVDLDYERLQRMFSTNVMGPFLCCKEAIKRMSTAYGGEGGTIVNVSSIASRTGAP